MKKTKHYSKRKVTFHHITQVYEIDYEYDRYCYPHDHECFQKRIADLARIIEPVLIRKLLKMSYNK